MSPEQHVLTSTSGEYTRDVWLIPGPADTPHPLCLFLDAEHYLRDMKSLPVLDALQESGAIPAMTYLFVSHISGASRHTDYTCNERYACFIGEDVVAWARSRANLQKRDHVLCGLSLSGLAAAHTALHYPDVFSFVLCQSGSFWWLADKELTFPTTTAKFWLSVGDQETAVQVTHPPSNLYQEISQIEGVVNAVRLLESLGGTVHYNLYSGGHAATPWREELAPALTWLVGDATGIHSAL